MQIIWHHIISGSHRPAESHSWAPMRCTVTRLRVSAILSTDFCHSSCWTYLFKSLFPLFTGSLRPGLIFLILVSPAPNTELGLQWMRKKICWAHDRPFVCCVHSRCWTNGCGMTPYSYFVFLFFIYLNRSTGQWPTQFPSPSWNLSSLLQASSPLFPTKTESIAQGLTWTVIVRDVLLDFLGRQCHSSWEMGACDLNFIWSVPSITP